MSVTTEDPTVVRAIRPSLKWWNPVDVRDEVCAEFAVSLFDLYSRRKFGDISGARHAIFLLLAERTRLSYIEMAIMMDVAYNSSRAGAERAERKMLIDPEFRRRVERVRERLNAKT